MSVLRFLNDFQILILSIKSFNICYPVYFQLYKEAYKQNPNVKSQQSHHKSNIHIPQNPSKITD